MRPALFLACAFSFMAPQPLEMETRALHAGQATAPWAKAQQELLLLLARYVTVQTIPVRPLKVLEDVVVSQERQTVLEMFM